MVILDSRGIVCLVIPMRCVLRQITLNFKMELFNFSVTIQSNFGSLIEFQVWKLKCFFGQFDDSVKKIFFFFVNYYNIIISIHRFFITVPVALIHSIGHTRSLDITFIRYCSVTNHFFNFAPKIEKQRGEIS